MNNSLNNGLQLKSAMWDAANTLRGSAVDRTDWKGYILPLLFFKRISDVWDEETAEAREIYGEADPSLFPEVHRFVLPEGCHWNDIREVPANVGAALQKAMQEIERANPDTLFRVFGSADWGNKEKFSDELLKDLIEGFSEIGLGNSTVSTDVLGDAYEYLVGKFADVTRFLDDGRICLTNNSAERALRGIALGRKAWLFTGSPRGGERAAFMYSLIVTAKMNDVDPQAWLADVLAQLPDMPVSRLPELLPWKWKRSPIAKAA